jgi:hypothetical protein
MMVNKTVKAIFTQIMNTITVAINGQGSVTKSPDQAAYAPGTSVTLTATPAAGWSFDHWEIDGVTKTENPTIMTA